MARARACRQGALSVILELKAARHLSASTSGKRSRVFAEASPRRLRRFLSIASNVDMFPAHMAVRSSRGNGAPEASVPAVRPASSASRQGTTAAAARQIAV